MLSSFTVQTKPALFKKFELEFDSNPTPAFLKPWVATQMWVAKTTRMGRESLYLQLLLAICTISLDQGCPTCSPATISSFLTIKKNTKKSFARLLKDIWAGNR